MARLDDKRAAKISAARPLQLYQIKFVNQPKVIIVNKVLQHLTSVTGGCKGQGIPKH